MGGALMQIVACGAQDIYLTSGAKVTQWNQHRYYKNEEIPINYSKNYPYTFKLNMEDYNYEIKA